LFCLRHIICEKPAFLHDLFFLAFHLPELFIGLYYIDLYRILFFFRHSSTSFSPFSKCTVRGSKKRSFFENLKLPINPSIFAWDFKKIRQNVPLFQQLRKKNFKFQKYYFNRVFHNKTFKTQKCNLKKKRLSKIDKICAQV